MVNVRRSTLSARRRSPNFSLDRNGNNRDQINRVVSSCWDGHLKRKRSGCDFLLLYVPRQNRVLCTIERDVNAHQMAVQECKSQDVCNVRKIRSAKTTKGNV